MLVDLILEFMLPRTRKAWTRLACALVAAIAIAALVRTID